MPRLALAHMLLGFSLVLFAAAAGAFVAYDATASFIHDPSNLHSWQFTILSSAHGHSNLFGILHILYGLTCNYSKLSLRIKKFQTLGLILGSLAMCFVMPIRAIMGPEENFDILGIIMGIFLSTWLAAVASHCYGLARKWARD